MSNTNRAEELIDAADDYMRLALDHLTPEMKLEHALKKGGPQIESMVFFHRRRLATHFLFPNLTEEERQVIAEGMVRETPGDPESFKKINEKARTKIKAFENKLTAEQMQILDCRKWNNYF